MKNWQMGSLIVLLVSALVVAVVVGSGQRTPKSEELEDTREVPVQLEPFDQGAKDPGSKPEVSEALKQKATGLGLARTASMQAADVALGRAGSVLAESWALFPEGRSDFFVHVNLTEEEDSYLTCYRLDGSEIKVVFRVKVGVGYSLFENLNEIKSVNSLNDYMQFRDLAPLEGEGDFKSYLSKPLRLIEYQFNPMNDVYTVTHLPSMKEELLDASDSGLPTCNSELGL